MRTELPTFHYYVLEGFAVAGSLDDAREFLIVGSCIISNIDTDFFILIPYNRVLKSLNYGYKIHEIRVRKSRDKIPPARFIT